MPRLSRHDLVRECFGRITLALDWIVTKFSKRQSRFHYFCDDIVGTSFTLSSLLSIFKEGYDKFNSTLWKHHREKPLESVDSFIASFEDELQYETYVENYLEILLRPLPPFQYLNHDLEKVVWACRTCRHRFECFYVFKEFLSYLDPHSNEAKKSVNYRIFRASRSDIAKVLETYLIRSDSGTGWSFNTRDRKNIDPYVTARLLDFFYDWNDKIKDFRFEKDFRKNSDIFHECKETLKRLQVKEDIVKKYNLINDINVKGAWREIQWGEFEVWRIKGASHIAKILYKTEGKKTPEIKEAKSFIERANGNDLSAVDMAIFSDGYTATVSDITGTIGVVDFYLSLGKEFGIPSHSDLVLDRIHWLLDQQRVDGAWPVLSERFWRQESQKDSKILRKRILTEQKMNNNNVSICNTMLMLNVLIDFLKRSLKE